MINKIELLSPAGDLEKLKVAMDYGADAVYCGARDFGLRAGSGNFTKEELEEGIYYVHKNKGRLYLTMNIFPHNEDILKLPQFVDEIKHLDIDAFIVSDPGIFAYLKDNIKNAEIHISTQANITNSLAASYWHGAGAKRAVLARELSMTEIRDIRQSTPESLELEAFVHGAMCISYSGRCLLSNFMTGRDANRGKCAHPCRWKYSLVEEKRPGVYFPIEEDARGSYIMNSGDLSMIGYIPELVEAGLSSLKIEGRVKSVFYVALVTGAYRKAIDAYYDGSYNDEIIRELKENLDKVSHRKYITGFYFHKPHEEDHSYESSEYDKGRNFTAIIKSYDPNTGIATLEQRNRMFKGDQVEITGPGLKTFSQVIESMWNEEGEMIDSAPHPQQIIRFRTKEPVAENFMVSTAKK